jgi:hypothetical protein
MSTIHPAWLEHQRKRFTRADAYRLAPPGSPEAKPPGWLDPSATRVRLKEAQEEEARAQAAAAQDALERELLQLRWEVKKLKLDHELWCLEEKYSPDQPRDDRGRWTDGSSGGGRNDPRVISDATPDNEATPGAQYAQGRARGTVTVRVGGRTFEVEAGQAARFVEAQTRADDAISRVREFDPNWRPTPSFKETVEGSIRSYEAEAREAQARASELAKVGIGPGPFAGESIPARGPERNFTAAERREINRIGSETGCHTCATRDPETVSGNFVPDHQPPNALNSLGRLQRLYPQCISCSDSQGGWIRGNMRVR